MQKEFNVAPLSGGFMLTSLVGIIISFRIIEPKSPPWGFTFLLFFVLMLVASMISMTYAPVEGQIKQK